MTSGSTLRLFWLGTVLALGASIGCQKPSSKAPPPPDDPIMPKRCDPRPTALNRVVPAFARPFRGEYPVVAWFDHDYPGVREPLKPPSALTFCGHRLIGLNEGHPGFDWALPQGTPVLAVADGKVVQAGVEPAFYCPSLNRLVNDQLSVEVLHTDVAGEWYSTVYKHLAQVDVALFEDVKAGQRLGLSGKTGCATLPNLHFEVHKRTRTKTGKPTLVDPYGWALRASDPWATHAEGSPSIYLWRDGEAPSLNPR